MIERILVAVADSPTALQAARLAVEVAAGQHAALLAVHVLANRMLTEAVSIATSRAGVEERRALAASSVLRHVAHLAGQAGVPIETRQLDGEPADRILEQARRWPADLVVLGRSERRGAGAPPVGAVTEHVLEFADQPVLVVPRTAG